MTGIYKITSPSGRVYIGQSRNIKKRWFQHKTEKRFGNKYPLGLSMIKYGSDNHSFLVVHELPSDVGQRELDAHEQLYIDLYRDARVSILNIKGAGSVGKHSEETKKILSQKLKAITRSREHIEKIISRNKSRIGSKLSQETKEKISVRAKERGVKTIGFTGRTHSEETKNKIAASCAKRRDSAETKRKKSIAASNRPPKSIEERNKISLARKGTKLSKESILKREATRREKYLKKKEGNYAVL